MEIYLPKTDTDSSKTGGDDTGWESIAHTSQTQKEAIVAFEKYLSILSERLRKIDIEASESEKRSSDTEKRIDKIDKGVERIEKISDKTTNLVIFGFFVLLLMVAGMIFAYWQFTYLDRKDTGQKIMENKIKMIELESQSEIFKNCLKSGGWNKCFN